jgi:hypothetical protein
VAKQNGSIKYTFDLSPLCFSLSSFPSLEHLIFILAITTTMTII